jgi:isopenicillin N synthase-like dioxygenase
MVNKMTNNAVTNNAAIDRPDPYAVPDAEVPIVDLSTFDTDPDGLSKALCDACATVGFVSVAGHGVDADLIQRFFAISEEFFRLPLEEKLKFRSPNDLLFQGYACPGTGPGFHTSERQSFNVFKFDTVADAIANGYPDDVGAVFYDAIWPERPAEFPAIWREYYAAIEHIASRLLRAFERGLGLADGWFAPHVKFSPSTLAANYYSNDIDSGHEPSPFRFPAHTDEDIFTILYQDEGPGSLQLHQRGEGWRNVVPVPGTFVVNIGELMARWTNDKLRATPHRVLAPKNPAEERPRMSAPFFFKPDLDAVIGPIPELLDAGEEPRYETYTGRGWLRRAQENIDSGYDTSKQFAEREAADPTLR